MAKSIKIVERKLGRENALGLAIEGRKRDEIHIDPRQDTKERMDTEIHEKLHLIFPDWPEKKVAATARKLTKYLWSLKYRKVLF